MIDTMKQGMLCLADRYYPSFDLWAQAPATGTDLLWRDPAKALAALYYEHLKDVRIPDPNSGNDASSQGKSLIRGCYYA